MSEHEGNIIAELTADHREVEDLFDEFKGLEQGDARRRKVADQFTIELVRHAVAEEMYLYPTLREHVAGGPTIADKELADHREVEQLLKDLEGVPVDDPRFDDLVDQIVSEVSAHVRDEEDNLFPALVDVCSQEQLFELGDQIRAAKRTAPTRPHPTAPDAPPANKLVSAGTGMVDRVRDFVTGRGQS